MSDEPGTPIIDGTLIKPIELDDAHGRWIFEPQADITPLEAVLINHMFCAMLTRYMKGERSRLNWREYLERDHILRGSADSDINALLPRLSRHFREAEG